MSSSSLPTSDTTTTADPLASAAASAAATAAKAPTATLPPRAPTTAATSSSSNNTSSTSLGDSSASSIPIPRRLGSISGLRTVSGSIRGLQGTGSFDDIALSTSNEPSQSNPTNHRENHHYWSTSRLEEDDTGVRRRANTDNNKHHASTSLLPGFLTTSTAIHMSAPQPPPVTAAPSEDSTNSHQYPFQTSTSSNDSADEEMKMAKAMALAVQSNPNLTPDEIRQLQQQQQRLAQQQQAKAAAAAASAAASTQPKSAASLLIPGRLSNVFHLSTNDIESSVHSGPNSSHNNSTGNMAPLQKLKNFQETFRASGQKARERFMDIVGTKSNEEPALTSSTHTTPTNHATPTNTTTTTTTNNSSGSTLPPAPPTMTTRPLSPIVTSGDTPSSGKRSPFRSTGVMKNIGRSLPMPSIATNASDADSMAHSVVTDTDAATNSGKSPANSAGVSTYTVGAEGPIRLTTIVWKRRSGLGKYSVHSAWERRRITLQGTKLSYYTTAAGNNDSIHDPQNSFSRDTMDDSGGVDSLPKKTNWFEQATASLVAGSSTLLGGEDPTTPRGYVDLIKDGATVAAATGHSGAPTPFAISIKVRGETKWKICFDMHKTQMEWLAAMTDVVVQGSVDAYNATLVDAMNPAHVDMFQAPPVVFEPPATKGAAATSTAPGGGHRLWMLGTYTIKSQNQSDLDDDGDDDDDTGGHGEANDDTVVDETTTRDEDDDDDDNDVKKGDENEKNVAVATWEVSDKATAVHEEAPVDTTAEVASRAATSEDDETEESDEPVADASTWSIPEKNLIYVASVLNISLALARASSTSIEGFWYLWVFANFALYQCTYHHVQKGKRVLFGTAKMSEMAAETVTITTTDTMRSSGGTKEEVITTKTDVKRVSVTTFQAKSVKALPKEEVAVAARGFKPVAGTTAVQIQNPTDVPMNSLNHIFAGWRAPTGDILQVRSHGYMTTKKKIPSPGELYKLAALDVFESPRRYPDMAPRVQLPKVQFDDGDKPKTWHSPDIFIISLAIPTDPPKMTGTAESDGGGYTVTMYLTMHQETRDILRRITAEDYDPSQEPSVDDVQKSKVNAVRLFEEWCRRAPTDPKFQSRFKLVPHAHNLKEIGMPGWISKYNGKPLLIKRPGQTGFLIPHPELSCIEFDISLHVFPFVAKKAICYVKEHFFRKVLVTFGFVIEGRADDELPECVVGLMQLCYPDPIHAIQAKDFFAGKCPRSFD